jgi:DNA-binding XRE family transcriptional regulator
MSRVKRRTSALEDLRRHIHAGGPERIAELAQTRREMTLGMKIRKIREEASMTQQQLADKIGTQPSAISRIEDADYDGHSLSLFEKVANALEMMLLIDLAPRRPRKPAKQM